MKTILLLALVSWKVSAVVVLLDPGHGGEELGAIGKIHKRTYLEKDLALKLALKVKDYLQQSATVYLTRSLDRTVSLKERAELADKLKADLFISIHFNSSTNISSNGFETYYLDNTQDAAVKKVEAQENIMLKGEELEINQILIDLVIQQTVKTSKKLAQDIHTYLDSEMKEHKLNNRGIKAGLFYVLALSKRPGVLIEVGFVSNPQELKKISQDKFMDDYARAIALGIRRYLRG